MFNARMEATQHAELVEAGRKHDLSLCATLISLFDFGASGEVSRSDWERGTSTLLLGGLGKDDTLWHRLLTMYDQKGTGSVSMAAVRDVLPIDPRISVLLQQLVHAVAGCREYVAAATNKAAKEQEVRSHRAVLNMRKRLLAPLFEGWRDAVRADRRLRLRAARHMRAATVARAWCSWVAVCDHAAEVAAKRRLDLLAGPIIRITATDHARVFRCAI